VPHPLESKPAGVVLGYILAKLGLACANPSAASVSPRYPAAEECKGKFASGRVSELVDSEVVFRGFYSCEDSDGARTVQLFVVP
jgi:hypothetical protein